jgi:hypothetical protein
LIYLEGEGIMKAIRGLLISGSALVIAMVFVLAGSLQAGEMKHEGSAAMQMHHFHILMNHGLGMVAGGSNMVMMAEMNMAPGLDPTTIEHGHAMVGQGKGIIRRVLSGPEMTGMMTGKEAEIPLMKYTHNLGETMLEYAELLEGMEMGQMMTPESMSMHHMHMMINHALKMAAEGSSLVMLGQMGMAGSVDDFTMEHGKTMMNSARALLAEVMEGKAMRDMMGPGGMTVEKGGMMRYTHKLAEKATEIMDMLEKMPAAAQ